jgi:hypothetical protein
MEKNHPQADTFILTDTIITPEYSKWLVVSSGFFTVPGVYAYYNNLHAMALLLFTTSVLSMNHWKNPRFTSIERIFDLVTAKVSFSVFFVRGIMHLNGMYTMVYGYSGLIALIYCYYLSGKLYNNREIKWYKYHMGFHFFVACEQLLVLSAITNVNDRI